LGIDVTGNNPTPRQGPQQIDRYIVVEPIGRGAMGVVYRARDEAVGRDVAIKLLVADLEDEPDIRTRFRREAETTAKLTHPNIITIFDIGEDRGRLYIVMELLRGATLKDYLKQGDAATPLGRKLDLMIQLCSGLGAAHNAGVYHRDIKPGNIFVRTDGILKILDFGIARLASSAMTRAGFILGTPDYMSPEQARGGTVDARSDIFSVGSVLYFMITGRKPFAATDLPTIFRQVESQEPVPLTAADAPPELARVVSKAMSKNPALRYQSCQELMTELTEVRRQYRAQTRRSTAVGRPATGANTEELETAHTGTRPTAHLDKAQTTHTDSLLTADTGRPPTTQTDKSHTTRTDNLQTAQTDQPKTAHTGPPQTVRTGPPQTVQTGTPQTVRTGTPQTAHTGTPQTVHPVAPQTVHPVAPQTVHPVAPQTVHPVAPQTVHPGTQQTAHTGRPQTVHTDQVQTEVPKSETREVAASPQPKRPADTADWFPLPRLESDDTVTLPLPLRFIERVGAFFSGVLARIRRARAEYERRQALRRKG
jgi:eukaryotic-like serine/threonine-protein kinase